MDERDGVKLDAMADLASDTLGCLLRLQRMCKMYLSSADATLKIRGLLAGFGSPELLSDDGSATGWTL